MNTEKFFAMLTNNPGLLTVAQNAVFKCISSKRKGC